MRTFPASARAFPVLLNRNAFGPRLVARAGDVWRAMQDVVVDQSSSVGWTPDRYVEAGLMFIVRHMRVVHHREVRIAESLEGRTWPHRSRRDMLFTREVRLLSGEELVATATQEWALLTRALEPARGNAEIASAFTLEAGFPSVDLPAFERREGAAVHHLAFRTWHLWMDAHAHANPTMPAPTTATSAIRFIQIVLRRCHRAGGTRIQYSRLAAPTFTRPPYSPAR